MVLAVINQAQALGVYFQPTRGGGIRAVGDAAAIDSIRELIVANKAGIKSHIAAEEIEHRKRVEGITPAWLSPADWSRCCWLVEMFCRADLNDAGELRPAAGDWVSIPSTVRQLVAALGQPDRLNRPLAYSRLRWFHALYSNNSDAGGAIAWRSCEAGAAVAG